MSSDQKLDLPLSETKQLSQQVRRAEALLALPHLAEQFEDEGDFLQQALEVLENLTESQISFVHFVNDDEQSIELITWSQRTLEYYCNAVYDKHYPVAQAGIWADALRQRKPVVFNDYAGYQLKRGLPSGHAHLERLISLPVINEGKVVMLTGVGNKPSDYNDIDVETVQLISNEIWNIAKRRRVLFALENLNYELEQRVEQRTAALQEREIRYRSLMDRASDAIILADSQGYCLETNFQAEKLLGYSKEEFQGMHLRQVYPPQALPMVQREFNKLTEQAFLPSFSVDFLTKKGELIPVDISASVIEIQGQRIIQSIARDVRDRLRYQEELKQKNAELEYLLTLREEALQLREDMSNMIIHDLRNPLTSIILAASVAQKIVEKGDNPNSLTKKLDTILYSSKRLQKMIDSLLLMAKLESGKLLFNPAPTDLYELGITVIADFDLLLRTNNITLKSELPTPEMSMVVDSIILRRVIENLLSNAVKFSPEGSQITLILEYLLDNHLRIQVIDEGPGVSPEKVQEIFKKFEIGTTKLNVSQIGLGLAFCKMVVEAQGGSITLTPNQPQGSIFTIEI